MESDIMGNISDEDRTTAACQSRATWRVEMDQLRRELSKSRREHKTAFADGFRQGSANAFARLYKAAPSDAVCVYISQLSLGARIKKPPFGLTPEQNAEIRDRVNDMVQKFGWSDEAATEKNLPL
jgi:hypothetical protein